MPKVITIVLASFFLHSCTKTSEPLRMPPAPASTEKAIQEYFPGAKPGYEYSDSLIQYLNTKFNIPANSMLLGASTCVDDIIYTKNFHLHPEIKGPFHLGGLAGLPFTGISGLEAFGHHIPEGGTMLLLIEPHIGYSEEKGWGYILRHEQHEASSCCGALMGTLNKLQDGTLTDSLSEEDYQGGKIAAIALQHKDEILSAQVPIVEWTRIISHEAEEQVRAHVLDIDLKHIRYIVIITGIIVNTDYKYTDYQYINHLSIYDTREKKFIVDFRQ